MGTLNDLLVYQKAFSNAMEIFEVSKSFPSEEKFALISQIRRSARSVCVNLAEAYRKRKYYAFYMNKISDCDGENSETLIWLEFAKACNYITNEEYQRLTTGFQEVGRLLGYMMKNPEKFGVTLPKS